MIIGLKKAVEAYLVAKLGADDSLDGITYLVRRTTAGTDLPEDRTVVNVHGKSGSKAISVLTDAMVEIFVSVPGDVLEDPEGEYSLLATAVENAFDREIHATADADLATLIEANVPGRTGGGYFVQDWLEGREETKFLPVFTVKVGLVKEGV